MLIAYGRFARRGGHVAREGAPGWGDAAGQIRGVRRDGTIWKGFLREERGTGGMGAGMP